MRYEELMVKLFMENLMSRNLDKLLELFADTVDWYIPGDQHKAPWVGRRSSKQEIKEFFELLWADTEPLDASVQKIFTDDQHIAIVGDFVTRMLRTNTIVNSPFSIYIKIENNVIAYYRLMEDGFQVSQALAVAD